MQICITSENTLCTQVCTITLGQNCCRLQHEAGEQEIKLEGASSDTDEPSDAVSSFMIRFYHELSSKDKIIFLPVCTCVSLLPKYILNNDRSYNETSRK